MADIVQIQDSEYDVILQQAVAVLPWGHTLTLMRKFVEDDNAILYYAQEIVTKGWNRELLSSAISMGMHARKIEPTDNNFEPTLPATQAMFANEVFQSGYNLEFLGVKNPILETELEVRLVKHIIEYGIIIEEEIEEQSQQVVTKIKDIEAITTPEVNEKMRELLAEMSILVAISNLKDITIPEEQVYHCSECSHEFHKHDVFCSNPKRGKS